MNLRCLLETEETSQPILAGPEGHSIKLNLIIAIYYLLIFFLYIPAVMAEPVRPPAGGSTVALWLFKRPPCRNRAAALLGAAPLAAAPLQATHRRRA